MRSQRSQKLAIYICIAFALVASVSSAPNWSSPEFFERQYHSVAPPPGEFASNSGHNTNIGNANLGSSTAPVAAVSNKEDTKALKARWSTRRRLSAREAVAVMEEELERREAAKAINSTIKDGIKEDIQPAASNNDPIVASTNRRSGHHMGVTGPVHTFVKTDKHGHYKWGVRHHAGHGFS